MSLNRFSFVHTRRWFSILTVFTCLLVCGLSNPVSAQTGEVTIDHVVGSYSPGTIASGQDILFRLRAINNSGSSITGIQNGFRIYSPGGAQWAGTFADTLGGFGYSYFNLVCGITYYNDDGVSEDTVLFYGASFPEAGLPDGYNDIPFEIQLGPIDSTFIGESICIDSCFIPPAANWLWASTSLNFPPEWDGPHCYTIAEPYQPPDTLINLVQWTTAMGGNDHWYGIIPILQTWTAHSSLANALTYNSENGYLATITSSEENQFIYDNLLALGLEQTAINDIYFIGGANDTAFEWITGEPFTYTNWAPGEPDLFDAAMGIWGYGSPDKGLWTSLDIDTAFTNSTYLNYALIEFGEPTIIPSDVSLVLPSTEFSGGTEMTQQVVCESDQPLKGGTIPLAIPDDVEVVDINLTGYPIETWDYTFTYLKPDSGFIFVVMANSFGDTIPAGSIPLFEITFRSLNDDCDNAAATRWDTTLYDDPARRLTFVDLTASPVQPAFDIHRDSVLLPPMIPGDANNDMMTDIMDILYVVDFMFDGGPPPPILNSIDVNGDCLGPDIADLIYLVDYQFVFGPAPKCGCVTASAKPVYPTIDDVRLSTVTEDGVTRLVLNSSIVLRGVQFDLDVTSVENLQVSLPEGLEIVSGHENNNFRGAILDMNGSQTIPAGAYTLFTLPGEIRINSALIADGKNQTFLPRLKGTESILPQGYILKQNYPNPFNPTTKISFDLPRPGQVRLSIYNIRGQLVSVLLDEWLEAGEHDINFDATELSSGIYLYRLNSDSFTDTKKMMLLK